MSSIEKLLQELVVAKGDAAYSDIERLLVYHGYEQTRTVGSHFHFNKQDSAPVTLPSHNGKVKICYVRLIIKVIAKEKHEEN